MFPLGNIYVPEAEINAKYALVTSVTFMF